MSIWISTVEYSNGKSRLTSEGRAYRGTGNHSAKVRHVLMICMGVNQEMRTMSVFRDQLWICHEIADILIKPDVGCLDYSNTLILTSRLPCNGSFSPNNRKESKQQPADGSCRILDQVLAGQIHACGLEINFTNHSSSDPMLQTTSASHYS